MAKEKKPAKPKGEFEKMGDLEKGVGEKKGSKEDIIKEIETFDATKTERPEGNPAEKPAGEAKPKEMKPEEKPAEPEKEEGKPAEVKGGEGGTETENLKKELDREREKTENLAKIIEKFSTAADKPEVKVVEKPAAPDLEPKLKEIESKMNEQVQSQMKDVKEAVAAMGKKMEETAKSGGPEKTSSKVKDMVDKVQADTMNKITEIEDTLKKMVEKAEAPKKEGEEISKGLAAFGGSAALKNEILEVRSSLKDLETSLNELRDETDTRITRVKEQVKVIEKLPAIEEKLEGLMESMSPGNIEKLKKFVFSADEITGEVIPNEVEKKVTKDLTPVFNDMKDVRDDIEKLHENIKSVSDEINYFKGELKSLNKLGDYVSELQTEKGKIRKEMGEKEANLIGMVNNLDGLIKKKIDLMYEKIDKFDGRFTGKLDGKVKECFDNLTESKFLELEDRTEKNLAVSRAKVNDMLSKFVQFQNVVNPTLSLVKEEIEKLNTNMEKLKGNQADLEEEIEENMNGMFSDITEPRIKEIEDKTSKFSESVSDRFDGLESEFLQFQNVMNPTLNLLKNDLSKLGNKTENLKAGHEDLKGEVKEFETLKKAIVSIKEGMNAFESKQEDLDKSVLILGNKLGETREEFSNVVKQTLVDRNKLKEESKKQRERINILLKELKG
ncbi:MAG: hypothetical protein V3U72_04575 [Candidatus Aenigmarchaeota archaeon]